MAGGDESAAGDRHRRSPAYPGAVARAVAAADDDERDERDQVGQGEKVAPGGSGGGGVEGCGGKMWRVR